MSEISDLSQTRHVQPNDPLSSQVLAQPTQSLEYRLRLLEQQRSSQATTSQNRLIMPNVVLDTLVEERDIVYFNATSANFQKALAGLIYNAGQFDRVPASMAVGVVVRKDGLVGDVMIGGFDFWQDLDKNPGHMFETGHTFRAGLPCYLSDTEAGKLTQIPPQYRVQVLMAMVDTFVVLPAYAFADTLEDIFTQALGLRPVGSVRALAPGQEHAVIVGFDGLEKHDSTNERWRLTSEGDVADHVNLGYCVADARIDVAPTAPCFVRIKVATNGVVTVNHAATLEDLGPTASFFGVTQTLATLGSTTFNNGYLWSATLYDPTSVAAIGQLWFRFTSYDLTYERHVILRIPDSFQGWKMVNDPRRPKATAVLSGDEVSRVDVTEPSVGFVTPPTVVFSSGAAEATASLDENGSIAGIEVTDPGTGYGSAPTISFDSRVTGAEVVNGGSGATFDLAVGTTELTAVSVTANATTNLITYAAHGLSLHQRVKFAGTAVPGGLAANTYYYVVDVLTHTFAVALTAGGSAIDLTSAGTSVTMTSEIGVVTAVDVTAHGSGYHVAPVLQVIDSLATGSGAVLRPIMVDDTIESVEVLDGGSGYTGTVSLRVLPQYFGYWKSLVTTKLLGGGESSASTVTTTTGDLKLVGVRVVSRGSNYGASVAASLTLSGSATGSGATFKLLRDDNGSITGAVVTAQGAYTAGTPSEFAITIDTADGGYGALLEPIMESAITALSPTAGSGFTSVPRVEFGVPLKAQTLPTEVDLATYPVDTVQAIPVDSPGVGASGTPTVTFSAPDLAGGTTAAATAYKGGWVTRVDVITAGSGQTLNSTVTITGITGYSGSGLVLKPVIVGGVVSSVDIINAGKGLTNGEYICAVASGAGVNGSVRVVVENSDGVVRVDLTTAGSGYTKPPTMTWTNVSGEKPVLRLMLLGTGAIGRATISGEGGRWDTLGTQAVGLQAKTWSDDFDTNSVAFTKPVNAGFYYNIKADPGLRARYPARPVEKCLVESNGVNLSTTAVVDSTGVFRDVNADVGLSSKTLVWHGVALLGTPWDPAWHQVVRDRGEAGNDATLVLPSSTDEGWRWWESLYKSQSNMNRGRIHVNRASRFSQSSKVSSLTALAPLKLIDTLTGADSEGLPRPMSGQLTVFLDNAINLLTPASAQVDLVSTGALVGIFFNDKGRPVVISSVLLVLVYQSNASGGAVPVITNAAKVTVGTAAGGYRNIVGVPDASLVSTPGVSTCLYAINQVKELTPDANAPSIVIRPNETVYLRVDQPAGAPILSQLVYARVKGQVL